MIAAECQHSGRQWYSVDLHIHSPASDDYDGDKSISPRDYAHAIKDSGREIVAITDHYSGAFIDAAKKAGRKIGLIVLGGVEVSVGGNHFVAIFPEDTSSSDVEELIIALGISKTFHGNPKNICPGNISPETLQYEVRKRNGILIAAHVFSSSGGIFGSSKDRGLPLIRNILPYVDMLELKPNQISKVEWINNYYGSNKELTKHGVPPILVGSDTHSIDHLGPPAVFLDLADSTFECIRQVVHEPALRVSYEAPAATSHSRIVSIETDSPKLKGLSTKFSPHLNTIIGGRGAGKSALLDLIRFATGQHPLVPAIENSYKERLEGFLANSFSVTIVYEHNGDLLKIRRSRDSDSPELWRWLQDRWVSADQHHLSDLCVEFFSQGEISRLTDSENAEAQLELIDSQIDWGDVLERRREIDQELQVNASRLQSLIQNMEALDEKVNQIPSLEKQVTELSKIVNDPELLQRKNWLDAKAWVEDINSKMKKAANLFDDVDPEHATPINNKWPSIPLNNVLHSYQKVVDAAKRAREMFRTEYQQASKDFSLAIDCWEKELTEATTSFIQRMNELGRSDAAERENLTIELARKSQLLEQLRSVEESAETQRSEVSRLHSERARLLDSMIEIRGEITALRTSHAADISNALRRVQVEIIPDGNNRLLREFLASKLAGSRIHNQTEVIGILTDQFSGRKLANALRDEDSEELAALTQAARSKLFERMSPSDLLMLDTLQTDDSIQIKLQKNTNAEFSELRTLSLGQKCSAVLAISLLSTGRPLVIDQPEDELDHAYIVSEIVKAIRATKPVRQLIIATHNPNIPVLGDAELVIRANESDNMCSIIAQGGLEIKNVKKHVLDLDGGRDAFARRSRRYGTI